MLWFKVLQNCDTGSADWTQIPASGTSTAGLDLPARQTVELKPGGYHIMLMDLKQPLVDGTSVPLTLDFEDPKGHKSSLELKVPVQTGAASPAGGEHRH